MDATYTAIFTINFSVVVICISLHLTIPVLQMQTLFQLSEGDYLRVYQL